MFKALTSEPDFFKRFFRLTVIIALQNVIVFGVNLADNIMLGAYSELSLSGAATVNQIQIFLQSFIGGAGEGIVVLASRCWGEHDIPSVKKFASVGMRVALLLTGLLFAATAITPTGCLSVFTDKTPVIEEGVRYLTIIKYSYIFFCLTNVMLATLRSVETVRVGFIVSLSTLVLNVCLNYCLIFGNFGFPELGIVGAAVATLVSRFIETVIVTVYLMFVDKKLFMRPLDWLRKIGGDFFGRFIKVSLPIVLSSVSWGIALGAQVAVLGRLEGSVIAANSMANTLFQILSVALYGAASATSVLIGKSIGEKMSRKRLISCMKTMQGLYLIFGLLTGAAIFFAKDLVVGFYNITPETRSLALQFMTVLSVTAVGTSYQMPCLTGIVRGGGDTKFVLFNDLIFIWLIVIPSAVLSAFVFHFPAVVVFACLKSDQILKCFVAIVKVNRFNFIKKV